MLARSKAVEKFEMLLEAMDTGKTYELHRADFSPRLEAGWLYPLPISASDIRFWIRYFPENKKNERLNHEWVDVLHIANVVWKKIHDEHNG